MTIGGMSKDSIKCAFVTHNISNVEDESVKPDSEILTHYEIQLLWSATHNITLPDLL